MRSQEQLNICSKTKMTRRAEPRKLEIRTKQEQVWPRSLPQITTNLLVTPKVVMTLVKGRKALSKVTKETSEMLNYKSKSNNNKKKYNKRKDSF